MGRFLWDKHLGLTRSGSAILCDWQVPSCFSEVRDMSYHPDGMSRGGWHGDNFYAAQKGKEFVIPEGHPEVEEWAMAVIKTIRAEH